MLTAVFVASTRWRWQEGKMRNGQAASPTREADIGEEILDL